MMKILLSSEELREVFDAGVLRGRMEKIHEIIGEADWGEHDRHAWLASFLADKFREEMGIADELG